MKDTADSLVTAVKHIYDYASEGVPIRMAFVMAFYGLSVNQFEDEDDSCEMTVNLLGNVLRDEIGDKAFDSLVEDMYERKDEIDDLMERLEEDGSMSEEDIIEEGENLINEAIMDFGEIEECMCDECKKKFLEDNVDLN